MKSLRARLTVGLAFSLVLLLMLQWAVASFVIEHLIENQLASRLSEDSENLLASLRFVDNRLEIDPRRVNTTYQRPLSGHYYAIDAEGQRLVSRSLWDEKLTVPRVGVGQEVRLYTTGPANQRLLLVAHGYRKQNADITIVVAEDLTAVNAGLIRFQRIYGGVSLAILVVLLLTQYLIVTRGLSPLKEIHADMARLERGEIDRIATMGPAEIAPVVGELNRLLAAMRKRTRRSREALGNLAHALKTRLSILSQAMTQPALADHPQLRAELEDSIETMRRIVERELKRARLMGDALPGRRVDIAEEVTLLAQTLRLMHAAKHPDIRWQVSPAAHFAGDQEDLLELLGNLLDNACKWCSSRVRLDAEATADNGVIFTVEDDGPGCPESTLDDLTRRGFRVDESKPGTGLGLAIVRDIVESYDGQLSFDHSDKLGGLRVQVRLPG